MAAPLELPVQLGHDPLDRSPLRDRMSVRTVGGRDDVLPLRELRTRPSPWPPARSRRAGIPEARLRGSGPRPSPRTGGSGASRGRTRAGPPRRRLSLRTRLAPPRSSSSGHYADRPMRAADQWARIEEGLDEGWAEVRLSFTPEGPVSEAAAVLGPLQPGRVGEELRFDVVRSGGAPERLRNILRRLDRNRIWGTLALVEVVATSPAAATEPQEETEPPTDAYRSLGGSRLGAAAWVERSPVRARARLERPPAPSSSPRRASEPDPRARRDRAALPRLGQAGVRRVPAHGATVFRADGRRSHRRQDQSPLRLVGHRERRDAGSGLASRRTIRLKGLEGGKGRDGFR